MASVRGDIVLIPFPYSDQSASKTRPTVVVSSPAFQDVRRELILAYLTSQILRPHPVFDYVLADWQLAGLLKPTLFSPRIAVVKETLVQYRIGTLSLRDLAEVDERLRLALGL